MTSLSNLKKIKSHRFSNKHLRAVGTRSTSL